MEITDWVSVFMALIATASATITYVVYRAATDPEVIVYAVTDPKRPSVVNLVIENIGNGPAIDITFDSDRQLPSKAYGIEVPQEMPATMRDGPLVVGVPYLAPKQRLVITWGQFGGLLKYLGKAPITVKARYKRSRSMRSFPKQLESDSRIDIAMFEGTDASDHNWGPKIASALDKTNKELAKINKSIGNLSVDESS